MSDKVEIVLNDVLLDRVSLATPFKSKQPQIDTRTGQAKPDKYHIDAIFGETHPQFKELIGVIRAAAVKRFSEKADQVLAMIKGNNQRFCLQRGDQYRAGKPHYAGKLYLSAGNETQPTILATVNGVNVQNRGSAAVLTPADDVWPYAGCKANVHLQFYGYDFNGAGIGCSVLGVQFAGHGPRLSNAVVSSGKEFGLTVGDADKPAPSQSTGGESLV
jgi:hypothetical protein